MVSTGVLEVGIATPEKNMSLKIGIFSQLSTGPVITTNQYDFFIKFIKLNFPFFMGIDYKEAYTFIYFIVLTCFIK